MQILEQIQLSDYSSWKVGGPADYFALPETIEDLTEAVAWAKTQQLPITVLSGGSNCLISDKGVRGLLICLRKFSHVTWHLSPASSCDDLYIEALAGTSKSELLKIFLQHRLAPALFLSGLPGDVGGGVVMNAGISEAVDPHEFSQIVDAIEVFDFKSDSLKRLEHKEIFWQYRASSGWQPGVITKVYFKWPNVPQAEILAKVKKANQQRLLKQPLEFANCGSVFKNPSPQIRAGALIDQCGLKGERVGEAEVSTKHANFIINRGEAKASDIDQLIGRVRKRVQASTGVVLESEIIYLGDWD